MKSKDGQMLLICALSLVLLTIELLVMGLHINGHVGAQAVKATLLILAAGLIGIFGITIYFAIGSTTRVNSNG